MNKKGSEKVIQGVIISPIYSLYQNFTKFIFNYILNHFTISHYSWCDYQGDEWMIPNLKVVDTQTRIIRFGVTPRVLGLGDYHG
ncbi:MAG: hypothetical protein EAX89_16910 [Candidatus Lokiarchaeota archaeon]|nr:hypothetical protein [Candidatus Lokiarchaeota archaeon]